ncbi:LacI family DNA-binding transcriptional regulator [Eubacterium oxidoreducens]|uniref:LacI family transcriptional regulator, repressor for deo operon, udp, cdd, tsx, nupC, and nupG n=1 Tax=Eubacterium oxidoreducens TaxID=1732 RepID=A0A1G6BDB7_EUBOX|nr:LacI family DNA-binding transcriptional regulator [Eubacterium oxidoreducens]SDB18595.1 LacI family transcriptional regulator, repressor for deo operon, udp, cdd, tsx, nupC, and nupG [Eubacterium oxidoreducens]
MSIKKIAKLTGVSTATVSRILNNPEYKCQSPETRERVWQTAIDLNYTPNRAARNLKLGITFPKQKSFFLNVLMTRTDSVQTDPFFNELLRVIESEIHKVGSVLSSIWYMPVFSDDEACERNDLQVLIDNVYNDVSEHSDGLIIIGKCNHKALQLWKKKYKAIVSINRNSTNHEVDEVICDGSKIAHLATNHLIELGHTQIAYAGSCHNEARYRGFTDALTQAQIALREEYVINTPARQTDGFDAMKKIASLTNRPTGIYCANDVIALGMLDFLNQYKNLNYTPSIIASDDIEEAQYTKPMLSTVRLPKNEMGKFAIQLLTDRLSGGHSSVTKIELEGTLVKRNSTYVATENQWQSYK